MNDLTSLVDFVKQNDGAAKARLTTLLIERFGLTRDRSVFYCSDFAIRISTSKSQSFSNTVLSLSNLRKYDHQPFVVCLVTPLGNRLFLANSTLLKKISHSSQQLREDNIRGSFNGSDIMRELEGIENCGQNLERLFLIHDVLGFEDNLPRLVEATNNISPTGVKFVVTPSSQRIILEAPKRALAFTDSKYVRILKAELDGKVDKYKNEILLAALIENVNIRGRIIEYIIAGEDEKLRAALIAAIKAGSNKIPDFKTDNTLGDYQRIFDEFDTETDVKTKIMVLNSNPKAYNLDKMLEFLSRQKSVFMFYFVGVDPGKIVNTVLVSIFQSDLLKATILLKHWAGRNSRGVSQFEGRAITRLIEKPSNSIDEPATKAFLERVISL
jgi:hypothetical protein